MFRLLAAVFCLLTVLCQDVFAYRNISCVATIEAKVLSCKERNEEVFISQTEGTEAISVIDLVIEVISVDPAKSCGYEPGQKIDLTIVRDDSSSYNRVKKGTVIREGTVIQGDIDWIADENGSSYVFEKISEVVN
jgi:hypothetical protein